MEQLTQEQLDRINQLKLANSNVSNQVNQIQPIQNIAQNGSVAGNTSTQTTSALVNPAVGQLKSDNIGRPVSTEQVYNPQVKLDNLTATGPTVSNNTNGRYADTVNALQNQVNTQTYLDQVRNLKPEQRINYNRYTSKQALGGSDSLLPNDYVSQFGNVNQAVPMYSDRYNSLNAVTPVAPKVGGLASASNLIRDNMSSLTPFTSNTSNYYANQQVLANPNKGALDYLSNGVSGELKNTKDSLTSLSDNFINTIKGTPGQQNQSANTFGSVGGAILSPISAITGLYKGSVREGLTSAFSPDWYDIGSSVTKIPEKTVNTNNIPVNTPSPDRITPTINENINIPNANFNRDQILQNIALGNNPNASIDTSRLNAMINSNLSNVNAKQTENQDQQQELKNRLDNEINNYYLNREAGLKSNSYIGGLAKLGESKKNRETINQLQGITGGLVAQQQALLAKQQQDLIEKQLLGENARATDLANYRQGLLTSGVNTLNSAVTSDYLSQLGIKADAIKNANDPQKIAQAREIDLVTKIQNLTLQANDVNLPASERLNAKSLAEQYLLARGATAGKQSQEQKVMEIEDAEGKKKLFAYNPLTAKQDVANLEMRNELKLRQDRVEAEKDDKKKQALALQRLNEFEKLNKLPLTK